MFKLYFFFFFFSEKCKEVGTTIILIRIIPYYLVHIPVGTAIPTSSISCFVVVVVVYTS